jgi:hypothetical protein
VIKLQCRCGHTLSLPDKLAGQKIRCKRCNKIMRVPPPSTADRMPADPQGELGRSMMVQGSRNCPGCGKIYPPAIRVCTECGLNVDTGAQLYVSLDESREKSADSHTSGVMSKLMKMLGLRKDPGD